MLELSQISKYSVKVFTIIDLQADVSLRSSTGDESLPGVSTLTDDLLSIPVI
jgi:hypothetical protein